MAHQQQKDFCLSVKARFPEYFSRRLVVDIGSLDINGNNQYLFESCAYLGIDLSDGKNVDIASTGHDLKFPDGSIDVVISTECFEHDQFYSKTIGNAIRMLKPGGLFLFTCATTGRPEHGTRRTTPQDAPLTQEFDGWSDYYKNLTAEDIDAVVNVGEIFSSHEFSTCSATCDLYFWGIKAGGRVDRFDYSFLLADGVAQRRVNEVSTKLLEAQEDLRKIRERYEDLSRDFSANAEELRYAVKDAISAQREAAITRSAARTLELRVAELLKSRSWRVTAGMRSIGDVVRTWPHTSIWRNASVVARRSRNAFRYVANGRWKALYDRARHLGRQRSIELRLNQLADRVISFGILATPHTQFVAHALQVGLKNSGFSAEIVHEADGNYDLDFYFVVCPQMFKNLPPGERRISFQMEQTVSSRWFKPPYLMILENSFAMLDYSEHNIANISDYGIRFPHVYFLPIGGISKYVEMCGDDTVAPSDEYDVVFYGDANSPRRQRLLEAVSSKYRVRVLGNVFGADLHRELAGAKVVLNIHYYEGALLETTRIFECLSLGKMVVSESSADQAAHEILNGVVRFFPVGDAVEMLRAVGEMIESSTSMLGREQYAARCEFAVEKSQEKFDFMLNRFLLANRLLDYAAFFSSSDKSVSSSRVALSLPETSERRSAFEGVRPDNVEIFDGLRYTPGWMGCALSYKFLADSLLAAGKTQVEIMEDDVVFPPNFNERYSKALSYLERRSGAWDVFVGVMAQMHPETQVLNVEVVDGERYVTIDRMMSMVYNIYTPKLLRLISGWSPANSDAELNTIDKFLQTLGNMRVVVALPFLVGHREEVDSSLWGFSNTHYLDFFAETEKSIGLLADRWLEENRP